MRQYYVNLPLRYAKNQPEYLEMFLEQGISPELGLDNASLAYEEDWHRSIASMFSRAGLPVSIHLPFLDLQPGSADDVILDATRRRLDQAFALAEIYRPTLMVGHANHDSPAYALELYPVWQERARATWLDLHERWPGHAPVYLENTFEPDPRPLIELLDALDHPKFGACLDIGHWFSFSNGRRKDDLPDWVTALSTHLGHLHLHDNDGSFDQHLGLGEGDIPFEQLFSLLEKHALKPGLTFEPHTREAFESTRRFVKRHPEWFQA